MGSETWKWETRFPSVFRAWLEIPSQSLSPAMHDQSPLVGGIEAGGTKFVCAIGSGPGAILARERFPTDQDGHPERTIAACAEWFRVTQARLGVSIGRCGVGSFGPVDLVTGRIGPTPKPGWRDFPIREAVAQALGVQVILDTDVNAAALSEHRWGAGQGLDHLSYFTIGTGIGGGAIVAGRLLHGALHPEMGHLLLPDDGFAGVCPFHRDCWEGRCSGPALAKRWGQPAQELPADHAVWPSAARSIAQGLFAVTSVLMPQRIILGGSVPKGGQLGQERFFALIRRELAAVANGYVAAAPFQHLDTYVVPPVLGDDAGVLGCFALAQC